MGKPRIVHEWTDRFAYRADEENGVVWRGGRAGGVACWAGATAGMPEVICELARLAARVERLEGAVSDVRYRIASGETVEAGYPGEVDWRRLAGMISESLRAALEDR